MNYDTSHKVLGLPADADEATLRARYLELIKRFTPERAPDEFRKIHAAYEAAKDPLVTARAIWNRSSVSEWNDGLEDAAKYPPELSPELLLALGNRDPRFRQPDTADSED